MYKIDIISYFNNWKKVLPMLLMLLIITDFKMLIFVGEFYIFKSCMHFPSLILTKCHNFENGANFSCSDEEAQSMKACVHGFFILLLMPQICKYHQNVCPSGSGGEKYTKALWSNTIDHNCDILYEDKQ